MNIIHIKYAVEIAKAGSINKASENLGMAQPNISRAIKDLEADLKITIFDRSAKGMNLTPEGKDFIAYAQKILDQLNDLENMFKGGAANKQKLSVSAPRSAYIAEAFAKFSRNIAENAAEILLDETDTGNTVKKVLGNDCRIGIIRYEDAADRFFKQMLEENNLMSEDIAQLEYVVLMNQNSPLAGYEEISQSHLSDLIQITHANPYAATLSVSDESKADLQENTDKCIYVLDSAAQLEILSENIETFMWAAPYPQKLLERYGLTQKHCSDNDKFFKDVLICRKGYKFSDWDITFVEELKKAAERYL